MSELPMEQYRRYRRALSAEPLPAAAVDLDAFDANIETLLEHVRGRGKTLRVATKSIRSVDLVRRVLDRSHGVAKGVMTFSAAESAMLVELGFHDVLLAYPVARPDEARAVALSNRVADVRVVVDCDEHCRLLERAAEEAKTKVPVIVDIDAGYRRGSIHIGVKRSPLSTPGAVASLAERAAKSPWLRFAGLMAYEAQIAGLGDDDPHAPWTGPAKRLLKRASRSYIAELRARIVHAVRSRGLEIPLFNGGGTGSVVSSMQDASLTEVTAGSGFFDSHLFDHYRDVRLSPAAFFAVPVVRRPEAHMVTCAGGGYLASGAAAADRAPIPWLPHGLTLTSREGAGEVQTPLHVPRDLRLDLGDPVLFRYAKAGELAERFRELLLLRGDRIEGRALTYRGMGHCFG